MPRHVRDALRSDRARRAGWRVLLGVFAGSFLYAFLAPSDRRRMRSITLAATGLVAAYFVTEGRWILALVGVALVAAQTWVLATFDDRGDIPGDRNRAARHEAYRQARIDAGFLPPAHGDPRD